MSCLYFIYNSLQTLTFSKAFQKLYSKKKIPISKMINACCGSQNNKENRLAGREISLSSHTGNTGGCAFFQTHTH
jgi:hypothetical protein